MLQDRGIRKGVEVLVYDGDERRPPRRATVVRTYPSPSRWFIVRFESGDMEQVEESQVTTMFEVYRQGGGSEEDR
jgi:hypothetical protein